MKTLILVLILLMSGPVFGQKPDRPPRPGMLERLQRQEQELTKRLGTLQEARETLNANPAVLEVLNRAMQVSRHLDQQHTQASKKLERVQEAIAVLEANPAVIEALSGLEGSP